MSNLQEFLKKKKEQNQQNMEKEKQVIITEEKKIELQQKRQEQKEKMQKEALNKIELSLTAEERAKKIKDDKEREANRIANQLRTNYGYILLCKELQEDLYIIEYNKILETDDEKKKTKFLMGEFLKEQKTCLETGQMSDMLRQLAQDIKNHKEAIETRIKQEQKERDLQHQFEEHSARAKELEAKLTELDKKELTELVAQEILSTYNDLLGIYDIGTNFRKQEEALKNRYKEKMPKIIELEAKASLKERGKYLDRKIKELPEHEQKAIANGIKKIEDDKKLIQEKKDAIIKLQNKKHFKNKNQKKIQQLQKEIKDIEHQIYIQKQQIAGKTRLPGTEDDGTVIPLDKEVVDPNGYGI